MDCVILAAGYATRLYPLTENFPKPLLPVGGRPILDWLTEDVSPCVERFFVVSNHRFAEQFSAWAGGQKARVTVVDDGTMTNETRLGAVRDIEAALSAGAGGDCLIMAGDNVLDFSLRPFLTYAGEKGTSCVMRHEENRPAALRKTAVITVDGEDLITSYEEKPAEPKGNWAVPPFYVYRAEDLALIPEALAEGCSPDAPGSFAAWLSRRKPMHAWKMPGARYDIGDLASYEAVRDSYKGPKAAE